jgi:hypothetical protein
LPSASSTLPISDLDIYRAAKLLIGQRGADPVLNAAGRANLLLEEGDAEGAAVWRATVRAIEELQREREPDDAMN